MRREGKARVRWYQALQAKVRNSKFVLGVIGNLQTIPSRGETHFILIS